MRKLAVYSLALMVFLVPACRGGKKAPSPEEGFPRTFPEPEIPSVFGTPSERVEYVATHFWDSFLDTADIYPSDTSMVNGVSNEEVESALAVYVRILKDGLSLDSGKKAVSGFFGKMETFAKADTSMAVFDFLVKKATAILYNPNSGLRDEDLFLPFVSALAVSPFAKESLRESYAYDVRMCSLNQAGSKAADFVFTELSGRRTRLHDIKAENTLLFFSNPGCPACADIIEELTADAVVTGMIESGKLAVVNVYIDEDVDKWREDAAKYPSSWHNGYDQDLLIRSDLLYNVRAIPSLYLLGKDKEVILKDAPENIVIKYINTLNQ